jgi:hypothetical protein
MPDAASPDGGRFGAVNLIGLIVIIAEGSTIAWIFHNPLPVNICKGLISFVALLFVVFLFGVAYDWGRRNIFVALAFVLSNVSSIIVAFYQLKLD